MEVVTDTNTPWRLSRREAWTTSEFLCFAVDGAGHVQGVGTHGSVDIPERILHPRYQTTTTDLPGDAHNPAKALDGRNVQADHLPALPYLSRQQDSNFPQLYQISPSRSELTSSVMQPEGVNCIPVIVDLVSLGLLKGESPVATAHDGILIHRSNATPCYRADRIFFQTTGQPSSERGRKLRLRSQLGVEVRAWWFCDERRQ